ncbi:MAG: hypothetical protein EOL89_06345 [Actinobacteria bacterium]|nr:hypothetical protein [Actinomycetota bacterium]
MPTPLERLTRFLPAKYRCTPPAAPGGLAASSGGGSSEVASAERCYAVSAVSDDGLEGPMSAVACGMPT